MSTSNFASWIAWMLSNFGFCMFFIAIFFILLHRILNRQVSEDEIVYRWIALFPLGFTLIYAAFMHAVYPQLSASSIGWMASPFQFEVAMANLAIGVLAVLSFRASYPFRLATVIVSSIYLFGAAIGHVYQYLRFNNIAPGNIGSWFWVDLFIPVILIICIMRMRRSYPIVHHVIAR